MAEIHIQYSTSHAFASGIIRRLCHSPFSHVDIVLNSAEERGLLGVSGEDHKIGDLGGVRVRPNPAWEYRGNPKVARLTNVSDQVYDRFMTFGHGQIGKPFDNGALWDFLSDSPQDRDWRCPDSWFCSEFVVCCLEQAGFFPYPLVVAKNRITPADSLLLLNQFLRVENIREFLSYA
jgi:hypothetical protein